MKALIKKIPLVNKVVAYLYPKFSSLRHRFAGSEVYWESRYRRNGNSGGGSYDQLCAFKAEILNRFVQAQNVQEVIDFGCGDGNQLKFSKYPSYLGFDVSPTAVKKCRAMFADDPSKRFKLVTEYSNETGQLSLSLDVIYHLVEDAVFDAYMTRLFQSSTSYIIIYASNTDVQERIQAPHVRHRKFSTWIEKHCPKWVLMEHIKNKFPYSEKDPTGSFADFYIYRKLP